MGLSSRLAPLPPLLYNGNVGVISNRHDLLGGRLNSAVNALRVARRYAVGCRIRWPDADHIQTAWDKVLQPPDVLFQQEFIDKVLWTSDPLSPMMEHDYLITRQNEGFSAEYFERQLSSNTIFAIQERVRRHCFSWENTQKVRADFKTTFDELPLSAQAKEIRDKVQKNALKDRRKKVCLHARRGDFLRETRMSRGAWPGFYWPDEVYEFAIEYYLSKDTDVYFFCGDPPVSAHFKARFPDIHVETQEEDMTVPERMLFDFHQLTLMSASDTIVSNGNSAFSAVASNLGGLENQHIKRVVGADMKACLSRLLKRLEQGPERFTYLGEFYQSINFLLRSFLTGADKKSFQTTLAIATEHDVPIERYLKSLEKAPQFADFVRRTKNER